MTDTTWVPDTSGFFKIPPRSEYMRLNFNNHFRLISFTKHDSLGSYRDRNYTRISINNGNSWNESENAFLWTIFDKDIIYGVGYFSKGYSAIKKSSDFGKTWTTINEDLPNEYVYTIEVIGNYLYAFADGGVYKMKLD